MGYVIGNIAGNVAVLSTKTAILPARIAAIAQWFEQLACIQPMAVQSRPSGSITSEAERRVRRRPPVAKVRAAP